MCSGKFLSALCLICLLLSNNIHSQWKSQVNLYGGYFYFFQNLNDTLFIGTDRGLFRTTNEGKTWSLNLASGYYQNYQALSMAATSRNIFYLNDKFVFRTTHSFNGWSPILSNFYFNKLVTIGDTLIAGSNDDYHSGVYIINSDSSIYSKVFGPGTNYNFKSRLMASANNVLWVFTNSDNGFYRSYDLGKSWSKVSKGLPENHNYPYFLVASGDTIYTVTRFSETTEIFYSTNQTDEWTKFKTPLPGANNVFSLTTINGSLYVALSDYISSTQSTYCAIYKTTDQGANWIKLKDNPNAGGYSLLYNYKNKLFQGSYNPYDNMYTSGVFITSDDGNTWISAGLRPEFNCIEFYYDYIWYNYSTFLGSDNGLFADYVPKNAGLPDNTSVLSIHKVKSPNVSGKFYIGTKKGLYYFEPNDKWYIVKELTPYDSVNCISTLFTDSDYYTFAGTNNGIFSAKNWNGSFKNTSSGLTNKRIKSLFTAGLKVFAGTEEGIFSSTDYGSSWTSEISGLAGQSLFIKSFCLLSDTIFIATKGGIYKSALNQIKWKPSGFEGKIINNVHSAGNYLFAGTNSEGVAYSSNFGNTWIFLNDGLNGLNVKFVKSYMNNLYAVLENYGFYMRTFEELKLPVELESFSSENNNNHIKLSWTTITEKNNRGFEIQRKTDLLNEYITIGFVKGAGNSTSKTMYTYIDDISKLNQTLIKYRLKQVDYDGSFSFSKESKVETIIAANPVLFQNFPNPFNPTTSIKYSVSKEAKVTLTLFNTIGQKVKELVNEVKPAGYYEVLLDASQFSSGIYYYRLAAGSTIITKKLIIQK